MSSVKVAISLPEETLQAADREVASRGISRSELFRTAVEVLLRQQAEAAADREYVAAYESVAEDEAVAAGLHALSAAALGSEPWDESR